jgi:hypothetical protein
MFVWDMTSGFLVASVPVSPCPCTAVAWCGTHELDHTGRETRNYVFATAGAGAARVWTLNTRCVYVHVHVYIYVCVRVCECSN